MSRILSAGLRESLDREAATFCFCLILRRADGQALGFTDHDNALAIEGIECRPAAGLEIGAIDLGTDLSVDDAALSGALEDELLSARDLELGLYDGAAIEIWRVDWKAPDHRLLLFQGRIGETRRRGAAFEAELAGPQARLHRPAGWTFSRGCSADLGDWRCRAALTAPGFIGQGAIVATRDPRTFLASGLGAFEPGFFSFGAIAFLSGELAGRDLAVRAHTREAGQDVIELFEAPLVPITPGLSFTISAGCDKSAETCRNKFNNLDNFRGFPFMPGDDFVLSSPEAHERNDGSSRWTR